MTITSKALALLLASGLLLFLAPLAPAVPGQAAKPQITIPPPGATGAAVDRLFAAKARLQKMEQIAWTRNPDLKRVEGAYTALRAALRQKQEASRKAIDAYLQKQNLTTSDLGRFKLKEITDLMMKILPAEVVDYPELKPITSTAIRQGQPVFPAEFAKQFPGKRPVEVPAEELLKFYKTQLTAEAARAGKALQEMIKTTQPPEFMVQSMQMLSRMKCVLIVYREYLRAVTPADLNRQRALVRQLEQQSQPRRPGLTLPQPAEE